MDQQKLLDWLNKEKQKDQTQIENHKKQFASQLKGLRKEDLFTKEKPTLWKRIKKLIWGI
jgi:hypothetical protein